MHTLFLLMRSKASHLEFQHKFLRSTRDEDLIYKPSLSEILQSKLHMHVRQDASRRIITVPSDAPTYPRICTVAAMHLQF